MRWGFEGEVRGYEPPLTSRCWCGRRAEHGTPWFVGYWETLPDGRHVEHGRRKCVVSVLRPDTAPAPT